MRAGAQDYLIKGEIDGKLLVRSLSYAIERKRLQGETQRHLEQITALKDINADLTSTLELSAVVNILLDKVHSLMPDVATTVRLRSTETEKFEPLACRNLDEQTWKEAAERWAADKSISNLVLDTRRPVRVNDLQNDPRVRDRQFVRQHGLTAYLGIALLFNEEKCSASWPFTLKVTAPSVIRNPSSSLLWQGRRPPQSATRRSMARLRN